MQVAFIGDVHSHLDKVHELVRKKPFIEAIFQVGDFGVYFSEEAAKGHKDWKEYKHAVKSTVKEKNPFQRPVYFCKGNHEDFNFLESSSLKALNIHFIKNGETVVLNNTRIGVLGGVYSPNKYNLPAKSLKGRRKRFFVKEEVDKLLETHKKTPIDILVTHIGATEFLPLEKKKKGVSILNNIVAEIAPKWYIHGHHHYNYYYDNHQNTEVQGLGLLPKAEYSYKILNL